MQEELPPRPYPSAPQASAPRSLLAAFAALYAGVLLALLWARALHPAYLAAGALATLVALVARRRAARSAGEPAPGPAFPLALIALAITLAAGLYTERGLDRIAADWDRLLSQRQQRLATTLDRRFEPLVERGTRAATLAATRAAGVRGSRLFASLAELRARSGVNALAVVDPVGEVVAWAGDHRGPLPAEVRAGGAITYVERPLFSYLYFARPVPGRGERAIAAVLLQTGLHVPEPAAGFDERFAALTGARPRFTVSRSAAAEWRLVLAGDTVLGARFDTPTQAEWRAVVVRGGRRLVTGLAALALLALSIAWLRWCHAAGATGHGKRWSTAAPLIAAAVAAAAAPLGQVFGPGRLFSPALFLLSVPGDVSLGTFLAVLVPLAALAAGSRPATLGARGLRFALVLGGVAVALGFTGGLRLLLGGAAPRLLEGGAYLWGPFQIAAVLLLALIAGLALPASRGERPGRPFALLAGAVLSLGLAVVLIVRAHHGRPPAVWVPVLWAIPFVVFGLGLAGQSGRPGRLLRWVAAGWLAATAALPYLWIAHLDARLRGAERELATLGVSADPFTEFLLRQFSAEVLRRHGRGEDGVQLLYRAWVGSGLAREASPVRIDLWSGGRRPEVELELGGLAAGRSEEPPPPFLAELIERARLAGQPVAESVRTADANQALAVPLSDGRVVTVIVPPRRTLGRAAALAPFGGGGTRSDTRLSLVPAKVGAAGPAPGEIHWRPSGRGWRSEALVHFPEGDYHAHLELRLPPLPVRLARGALLLALDVVLLGLLWLLGGVARGEAPVSRRGVAAWLGTFRARVTLALFAFFLVPTIVFGAVAYQALAGEVVRAARLVAERAVTQAVLAFPEAAGDLRTLAGRTGEEVLYYHRGELAAASSHEARELGLFAAWMPAGVFLMLESGEEMGVVETAELAPQRYLFAYRRLPVAGTLAVPVSLAAGEAAERQREIAHLVLFAALMGGLLSLALSLAVGRALARPISRLRRAAALVGAGQLRVRLPEHATDEFGELFGSFNHMVRRLRRARAQEVRTARVLAWGEMARQVAHEIKNPLTPIKLSIQHLRRAFADRRPDFGAILDASVRQILAEIDRLGEIARVFSRYGAPAPETGPLEPVDVAGVVREVLTLYRTGEDLVTYDEIIEPGLPPARARAAELKEVLLNLLENARAALDGRGTVRVRAGRVPAGIELSVHDHGAGIPPELLPRVFDPHFSTRTAGTGLGLAIVRRLVEGWGGSVTAASESGRGTTVCVVLPLASAGSAMEPAPPPMDLAPTPRDESGS
ncbi:MAG: HAMP domain-containing protein [Gemmatimonadetes bacterium]|nr:HAMP domain-containing protein [Gemmatimonadota bacterium]